MRACVHLFAIHMILHIIDTQVNWHTPSNGYWNITVVLSICELVIYKWTSVLSDAI